MTNPTEITNIIELTNLVEMTNTITNVVTNVLDKIDIVSVDKIKGIPIDWVSVLGAVFSLIGGIIVPVMLALWIKRNEDRRYEEQQRKEKAEKKEQLLKDEREFIQKFIDTRLEMPKFSEIVKYTTPEEREDFIYNALAELAKLPSIIESTKYNYLSNYIDKIISIIRKYNNADDFPFYYGFIIGSIHIITRYMNIGEETFNKIWEKDFEAKEKDFEKLLEDNKKQKKELENSTEESKENNN